MKKSFFVIKEMQIEEIPATSEECNKDPVFLGELTSIKLSPEYRFTQTPLQKESPIDHHRYEVEKGCLQILYSLHSDCRTTLEQMEDILYKMKRLTSSDLLVSSLVEELEKLSKGLQRELFEIQSDN